MGIPILLKGDVHMSKDKKTVKDVTHEGRDTHFMDIDRMVNEGLGGGLVTIHNGLIEESTTETMVEESSPNENGKQKQ